MNYLIIILLMQALLFGFLFSEKMRAKYVFILNGILFFILFGLSFFKTLLFALTEPDFYDGFRLTFIVIWLVSFSVVNLLLPFLLSYVSIGLHKSIFYKKNRFEMLKTEY